MIFKGVVGFISGRETGVSKKGNNYQKGYFIVGEPEVQYPNEFKFEWYREGESSQMDNLKVGHEVTVDYRSKVSEFNGKHYGKCEMFKLQNHTAPIDEAATSAPIENKYSAIKNAVDNNEPIPF